MPVPPTLTADQWKSLRRQLIAYAYQKCVKNVAKAKELTQAAISKSLEPGTTPWDPGKKTFAEHLCSLLWSLHGNESKSFRVQNSSFALDEPQVRTIGRVDDGPEHVLLDAEESVRARRLYSALEERIEGDTLVLLLLDKESEPFASEEEAASDSPGDEMPAVGREPRKGSARPRTLPASTRRALAKGYGFTDIKHARERLKRHALAVFRKDTKDSAS